MASFEDLEARLTMLEARMTILETQARKVKARRKKEYTDEERAAVRARLLAGQEAARKRREAEAKPPKAKPVRHLPPPEPKV